MVDVRKFIVFDNLLVYGKHPFVICLELCTLLVVSRESEEEITTPLDLRLIKTNYSETSCG